MPPLVGSDEESSSDEGVIRAAKPAKAVADQNDEAEDDDDDEEGDAEEYVIEEIEGHTFDDDSGEVLYKVKWEGWDAEEDKTWEPEDNLASAKATLKAYWNKIGGKPSKAQKSGPGKKRKATSTPAGRATAKRGKSETPEASVSTRKKKGADAGPAGNTVVKDEFKLPKGSWEDQVASIDTIEEALDEKGDMQRYVYVMWNNGNKTRHQLSTVNQKCPQQMLRYYESHLVFKQSDAETNGGAA